MYYNRGKEQYKRGKYLEGWYISKKYTEILMEHSENDKNLGMCFSIYGQYMNELKNKRIPLDKKINYIQCWDTLLNTILKNSKINVQRCALKLLHQTSVQRAYSPL